MSSVFISYNSKDKRFAQKLGRDLGEFGIHVWLDEVEIQIGESLIERIRAGIDETEFLAVILSPNSVESEWVKKEVDIAMNQEIGSGRVKVLPLLLESCPLPGFLVGKLYADFRDSDRENYRGQLNKLAKRILGKEVPPHSTGTGDIEILRQAIAQQITELSLTDSRIRALDEEELGRLTNLHQLDITSTQVSDTTPLRVLKKLRVLHLGWQSAEDLRPIARLSKIEELHVYGAQVKDFSPLSKLTNLRLLEVVDSSCENFASLGGLFRLRRLRISIAQIPDFGFLSDLDELEDLSLYDTWIRNLSPVAGLRNLRGLGVPREPVSSLGPISSLTLLERLNISETDVTNLEPLAGLPNLRSLDVAGLEIADWEPMIELKGLREIDVRSTNIPVNIVRQLHRKFPDIKVIRGEIEG